VKSEFSNSFSNHPNDTGGHSQWGSVDVVSLGETMGLMRQEPSDQLELQFSSGFGGTESNVMTQMSRLGLKARWISSLGNDAFGSRIAQGLANEGVQVFCPENNVNNTGLMIKTYAGKENPDVAYYRKDSAASRLDLKDVPSELISTASLIHITGIYPALSSTSLETTMQILEIAKQSSLLISLDVNYRAKLWGDAQSVKVLSEICCSANHDLGRGD